MGSKETHRMNSSSSKFAIVKPEPQEPRVTPLSHLNTPSTLSSSNPRVKPEPSDLGFPGRGSATSSTLQKASDMPLKNEDINMSDISASRPDEFHQQYTIYGSALDVPYTPENALKEGSDMTNCIRESIRKLEIGSKLRKDVWLKEIESLRSQGTPSTMVAVCGPTGAGKSSLLNAVLDDAIVPTSGMRACTAVVTEISYHNKKTIEADVSFLKLDEWRQELIVLLNDLIDEDGNVKRTGGEAGIAWSKVHAVYPSIDHEHLKRMTVDQILAKDPGIASLLGTTKHIIAKDSTNFAKEIAKYIDSKDQKRADKKDKSKSKNKEKSMIKTDGKKHEENRLDGPALWPLISQVKVYCSSAALSSGVILVDLPGTGDANAARNNIAKQYMKNCDCVWILAPITRAVDDKTARDLMGDAFRTQLMMDGNYDTNAITFIATKCDDISCSEVIRALQLDDDPVLEEIETRIEQYSEEMAVWKEKKSEAEFSGKEIDKRLKGIRAYQQEYKEHLQAIKDGETFSPKLTAIGTKSNGKKRKNNRKSGQRSPKRRKNAISDDEDEFTVNSDDDSIMDSSSDSESHGGSNCSTSDSDSDDDDSPQEAAEQEVTEESLEAKIEEAKGAIKVGREQLSNLRKDRKEAVDAISALKKKEAKAQREKNAFCSLKRSEFSRDVLKEDFRQGLKDMDDAAAEQRNPDTFDPTVKLRDYEKIDLPVFTCSSRDYIRLKGQVKGDGEPTCFSHAEDTCIPAVQEWCHKITTSSRERAARNFLIHLRSFANSVRNYIEGFAEVTEIDRATLREKWESSTPNPDDEPDYGTGWGSSDPLTDPFMDMLVYGMPKGTAAPKVDPYGEPVGVTPRLIKDFSKIVESSVAELKECFRDGLEEKCQLGAANAAAVAVQVSDEFAASMHWATYRATLRRHGEFRRDLNVELATPLTKNIASSWSKVFESDLFATFETATKAAIEILIKEIEDSAPIGLKDRTRSQGQVCQEEANIALNKTLDLVKETMNTEQKEVSRLISPYVQQQLVGGYDVAYCERGTGSVARQKKIVHDWIEDVKDEIFVGSADTLMERLAGAAQSVGNALNEALGQLAEKVEVSLAVLWEEDKDDPAQNRIRAAVVKEMKAIMEQLDYWKAAEGMRKVEEV